MPPNNSLEFEFLKEQIQQINKNVSKLSDNQSTMNAVLIENTVIVKEHERRSTAFEGLVGKFEERLAQMVSAISDVSTDVAVVESELGPIKEHVGKVSKIVNFLYGIPVVLKVTVSVVAIASALYGAFSFIQSIMPKV